MKQGWLGRAPSLYSCVCKHFCGELAERIVTRAHDDYAVARMCDLGNALAAVFSRRNVLGMAAGLADETYDAFAAFAAIYRAAEIDWVAQDGHIVGAEFLRKDFGQLRTHLA